MLDVLLEADDMSVEMQNDLLALFTRTNNTDGLIKLCQMPGLDGSIDAKLAKVPTVAVRLAWLKRPGRTQEEIVTMVEREKRVTVLTSLAGMDLPQEVLKALVQKSDSNKVRLAIMNSKHANALLRSEAIVALAQDKSKLSYEQQSSLAGAVTSDPELALAVCEVTSDMGMLKNCIETMTALTDKAETNIVSMLQAHTEALFKPTRDRWSVESNVRRMAVMMRLVVTSGWCTPSLLEQLGAVTESLETLETQLGYRQVPRELEAIKEAIAAGNGAVTDTALIARAKEIPEDEVQELLRVINKMPDEHQAKVMVELLKRPDFAVATHFTVLSAMPYGVSRQLGRHFERGAPSVETAAAMVLSGHFTGPTDKVATLAIANLDLVGYSHLRLNAIRRILASPLAEEKILAVPAAEMMKALEECHPQNRKTLAAVLMRELSEMGATALAQFDSMAADFPGSVRQLLEVCRASTA